jgi:hypothetical protein
MRVAVLTISTLGASGKRADTSGDEIAKSAANDGRTLAARALVSDAAGGVFTDLELVAMATRNAAEILRWDHALGLLEAGKFADLMVVDGLQGDPYAKLLEARETNISLVVIDGMPRCGRPRLMAQFGVGTEAWRVGRAERLLHLEDEAADPDIHPLTLHEACERLRDGLRRLPELALELEQPRPRAVEEEPQWFFQDIVNDKPNLSQVRFLLPWYLNVGKEETDKKTECPRMFPQEGGHSRDPQYGGPHHRGDREEGPGTRLQGCSHLSPEVHHEGTAAPRSAGDDCLILDHKTHNLPTRPKA